jgi:hypothetical protein
VDLTGTNNRLVAISTVTTQNLVVSEVVWGPYYYAYRRSLQVSGGGKLSRPCASQTGNWRHNSTHS